ncbi:MAG: tetratricopeptide repeat protein [Fimbriimonadaceae bacterium]|nr:tetratricopeptide repeat protein [Fimbriimonadaceae bacterium]
MREYAVRGYTYLSCCVMLLAVIGCSQTPPLASKQPSGVQMPPTQNPKERQDEERLSAAIEGLSFASGAVKVISPQRADRSKSIKLTQAAEKCLNVDNVWFKAAGLFRDAILADPSHAPAYEGLSRAIVLEGGTDLASAALNTAISLDPGFLKARYELGVVTQMTGDYKGAIQAWKELVARDPNYPDAYARLAIASYFDQDFKSARMYLEEADKRKQSVPPQFRDLLQEVSTKP